MENEDIEIGKLMTRYLSNGDLITFKLRESRSKYIGKIYENPAGIRFIVIGQLDKKRKNSSSFHLFLVEFEDGVQLVVSNTSIANGEIRSPNHKNTYGVGFRGQGVHRTSYNGKSTKEYVVWHSMIQRCYDLSFLERQPTYIGCSVASRWHNFQNFCEDIKHLEGYKEWKENTIKNAWALDKDIKIAGNKVYSKDTCMFVTHEENTIKAHKGVECNLTGKTYLATFLETGYTEEFDNQRKFARDNSISQSGLSLCIKGKLKQHKGWSFKTLE